MSGKLGRDGDELLVMRRGVRSRAVSLAGDAPGQFAVAGDACSGREVAPGQACGGGHVLAVGCGREVRAGAVRGQRGRKPAHRGADRHRYEVFQYLRRRRSRLLRHRSWRFRLHHHPV